MGSLSCENRSGGGTCLIFSQHWSECLAQGDSLRAERMTTQQNKTAFNEAEISEWSWLSWTLWSTVSLSFHPPVFLWRSTGQCVHERPLLPTALSVLVNSAIHELDDILSSPTPWPPKSSQVLINFVISSSPLFLPLSVQHHLFSSAPSLWLYG